MAPPSPYAIRPRRALTALCAAAVIGMPSTARAGVSAAPFDGIWTLRRGTNRWTLSPLP